MCDSFCLENGAIQFSEFKENKNQTLQVALSMAHFISGMSPSENRLRWDRLQALHFVLMMFLNSYGYDFQYTDQRKLSEAAKRVRPSKVTINVKSMLNHFQLGKEKHVKQVLKAMESSN